MKQFNKWLGTRITESVSTMWAAYLFTVIALISLPGVLSTHNLVNFIGWFAQTFLQLVLLAVILYGQKESSDIQNRKLEQILKIIINNQQKEITEVEKIETEVIINK